MGFKKLSYNGTQCNSYLYFSFYADLFNTDLVTKKMEIEPTSIKLKSNPIPIQTSWNYKIYVGNEIDIETAIEKLIKLLEPKIETIHSLKNDLHLNTCLQFVIDIDVNPKASTPYIGLKKRTINFLSNTETEVYFDLYKG